MELDLLENEPDLRNKLDLFGNPALWNRAQVHKQAQLKNKVNSVFLCKFYSVICRCIHYTVKSMELSE